MKETDSYGKSSSAQHWLTLVEFSAPVNTGQRRAAQGAAPGGPETIYDRLAEILGLLNIPEARLSRIQAAVESAVLHAAGRLARPDSGRVPGVSVRVLVSRRSTGEDSPAGGGQSADPWRATVPIWTGGPYGWGFFLVERAWGDAPWGEAPPAQAAAGIGAQGEAQAGTDSSPGGQDHLIQLFLYPEGGPEPSGN